MTDTPKTDSAAPITDNTKGNGKTELTRESTGEQLNDRIKELLGDDFTSTEAPAEDTKEDDVAPDQDKENETPSKEDDEMKSDESAPEEDTDEDDNSSEDDEDTNEDDDSKEESIALDEFNNDSYEVKVDGEVSKVNMDTLKKNHQTSKSLTQKGQRLAKLETELETKGKGLDYLKHEDKSLKEYYRIEIMQDQVSNAEKFLEDKSDDLSDKEVSGIEKEIKKRNRSIKSLEETLSSSLSKSADMTDPVSQRLLKDIPEWTEDHSKNVGKVLFDIGVPTARIENIQDSATLILANMVHDLNTELATFKNKIGNFKKRKAVSRNAKPNTSASNLKGSKSNGNALETDILAAKKRMKAGNHSAADITLLINNAEGK